jgi:hypothetical protein
MKLKLLNSLFATAAVLATALLFQACTTSTPAGSAARESGRPKEISPRPRGSARILAPNTITIVKANTPPQTPAFRRTARAARTVNWSRANQLTAARMAMADVTTGTDFYLHFHSNGPEIANVKVVARFANLREVDGDPVFETGAVLTSAVLQGNTGGFSGYFTGRRTLTVVPSETDSRRAFVKIRVKNAFLDTLSTYNGIHVLAALADANGEFTNAGDIFLYVKPGP